MPLNFAEWLPITRKEIETRGWNEVDVVFFSGDAYVDHPSFGTAVIGRVMEAEGLRVAIVPQPNWRDDLRDFKKFGRPRLFFAITAGCMDSMVNHYTANKRRRSDDAYTPGGKAGFRPDYATITYSNILKKLYPDVPILIGGIEASLRRLTHYDYWSDRLMPNILWDSHADMLIYGMGEKPLVDLIRFLKRGIPFKSLTNIPQTAFLIDRDERYATQKEWSAIQLPSHEECIQDKKKYAISFRIFEEESNKQNAAKLIQSIGNRQVVINPPYPIMTEKELDKIYDLPFTRQPHPKYRNKGMIPAYEMIRHSVNIHRGCFGGCAFCTISAHQGKFIVSRSEQSVLKEVKQITQMPDFKGNLSDLGGPSANMYQMHGIKTDLCKICKRASCIFPSVCKNLNINHENLLKLYHKVTSIPGIKKAYIGSGIRYDMILHDTGNEKTNQINKRYLRELIKEHVSGRLKVAPEHSSERVLKLMRKPSFELFKKLATEFNKINKELKLNQQLIPYFISSHPGSQIEDMAQLAIETKKLDFHLEQVQDFTPTPMTLATTIYYTGYNPYTLEKVYTATSPHEKLAQRQFFFWYKPEYKKQIIQELKKAGKSDYINRLFSRE